MAHPLPPLRPFLRDLAILVLLVILVHLEETWRGRRAWLAWTAAQSAAGQTGYRATPLTAGIPEADNFAAAPVLVDGSEHLAALRTFWQAVPQPRPGDWTRGQATDFSELRDGGRHLVKAMDPFEDILERLAEAAHRPASGFSWEAGQPLALHRRVAFLGTMARVLHLRAEARLHAGQAAGALDDLETLLRISRQLQGEPRFLAVAVARQLAVVALQPIWDGLHAHAWTPGQLLRLQTALGSLDLAASAGRACQGERWGFAQAGKALDLQPRAMQEWFAGEKGAAWRRWLIPKGWAYLVLAAQDQAMARLQAAAGSGRRILPLRARDFRPVPWPYRWAGGLPGTGGVLRQLRAATWAQACLDQARTACALERFRLARGGYPGSLAGLAPDFLAQPPLDRLTGSPLGYTLGDGGFRLGATGWPDPDERESPETAAEWTWRSGQGDGPPSGPRASR